MPVIDGFVQFIMNSPDDMLPYLKPKDAPCRAEKHDYGRQAMGGYDPYIEAIYVDDLTLCVDTETGKRWFDYTRRPAELPRFVRDRDSSK